MKDDTEEILEDFVKRNPDQYKIYRNNNGSLYEVYDIMNCILWCKKMIYVGSNKKKRNTFWVRL